MAQDDLIKEIVFISDEQYEAPAFAWGVAVAYLVSLVLAGVLTTFVSPLVGGILYGLILVALLVQSSIGTKNRFNRFLVVLSLVPLSQLLSLTTQPANLNPVYWYLLVGTLLGIVVLITFRLTGFDAQIIGLRVSRDELPLQLLIGLSGLVIGFIAYLLLRPGMDFTSFTWFHYLLFALLLLVFTGLIGEIVFRGLLQASSIQILGRLGILYVALVFTLQYLGFRSLPGLLFIFLFGLASGWLVARTRSLVGVSLAHGLANISLFLAFPLLMSVLTAKVETPQDILVQVTTTPSLTPPPSPTLAPTLAPQATQPLVLIPVTGRTATPTATISRGAACDRHINWVVYVTREDETLQSISALYGISAQELSAANCFEEDYQVSSGQGLFVPYDLIPSPTSSPVFIFSSMNTPTITPTRKPDRKPAATPTSIPTQVITPTQVLPTATPPPPPPPPTPGDLPTLAPTQMPPPPPPTPEN